MPSDGTSLSSALPSPAWSRRSRRRRAPIVNAHIPPYDSSVSCDHVTRSYSMVSLDHVTRKSSVDHVSADEVPLDLCSSRSVITVPLDHCSARSDLEVPLDHINKSSNEESLVIDLSADVFPLN